MIGVLVGLIYLIFYVIQIVWASDKSF
jgi:hypothetical protein